MPDPATKDDIERVVELLHDIATRVDQRFDERSRRVERYAARGEARLRILETTDDGTKERFQLIEHQVDDDDKRLKNLEQKPNPGQAA